MEHGDTREGKWRGNWRMEWVASNLHTTSEHCVSSITTHTSAASSRLNWHPRRFKWTCPFPRKTKSGFCACNITFPTQSTIRCHEFPDVSFAHIFWYLELCLIFLTAKFNKWALTWLGGVTENNKIKITFFLNIAK